MILAIRTTMPFEEFKVFVDHYIRGLDILNLEDFENRLSFLSYVFFHLHGGWVRAFIHVVPLVVETISIFRFSPILIEALFRLLSLFKANMKENTVVFVEHIIDVILQQFRLFTSLSIQQHHCPLWNSVVSYFDL